MASDPYRIDLTTERGSLRLAQQLWQRFCEDLMIDPAKARVRLVSGIQIAVRDARAGGFTDALFYDASSSDELEGK